MAYMATASVFRQIESLFEGSSVVGMTDRQFLERFIARRDPAGGAAFAALVARHGPKVLNFCRPRGRLGLGPCSGGDPSHVH
jgi:hypothetical protein